MPKTKIIFPEKFSFVTNIPIRITDLNYGGHVGNDSILSLIHEARIQFLRHHGYTELDMAGVGLIMADAAIEFKSELMYGDTLRASLAAGEFSKVGFDLFYKMEKMEKGSGDKWIPAVYARTGMVCFNYTTRKVASLPEQAAAKLAP